MNIIEDVNVIEDGYNSDNDGNSNRISNPNRISYTLSNGTIQYIENEDCIKIYHLFVVSSPREYLHDLMVQLLALQDFYNMCINPRECEYIRSKVIIAMVNIIEKTTT